jgi:hypothetical protein
MVQEGGFLSYVHTARKQFPHNKSDYVLYVHYTVYMYMYPDVSNSHLFRLMR